ncbi:MAG TPA: pyridoxal-5'-phosphate-dependent protein subunit beta, partial [Actinomycetota bacterium]|nr:pyridoxal-5'-phosphate-dependent protein subunit beta [Actinomycetota bacterium]
NTDEGRAELAANGVDDATIATLDAFGISSIANVLAAIKTAKLLRLGHDDVIVTVATDGARMYRTEVDKVLARDFSGTFGAREAAETFGRSLEGQSTGDMLELTEDDRERIFNLGYFTWVEQQGVSVEDFTARRDQAFWRGLRERVAEWDAAIGEVNEAAKAVAA